jgi:hypothetical protein
MGEAQQSFFQIGQQNSKGGRGKAIEDKASPTLDWPCTAMQHSRYQW